MGKLKPIKQKKSARKASVWPMLIGLVLTGVAIWFGVNHAPEMNAWFVKQYNTVTHSDEKAKPTTDPLTTVPK